MYLFLSGTFATIIKTGVEYFLQCFPFQFCNAICSHSEHSKCRYNNHLVEVFPALSLSSVSFQIHSLIHIFYFSFFSNHLFHYISKDTSTFHFSVCFLSIYKTDPLSNCLHFFPFCLKQLNFV